MRDVKLGIKKDATCGANDEDKHDVDIVSTQNCTQGCRKVDTKVTIDQL